MEYSDADKIAAAILLNALASGNIGSITKLKQDYQQLLAMVSTVQREPVTFEVKTPGAKG